MAPPKTRYASGGGVRIAYQVVGNGPIDLVFVPGLISHLDINWEDSGYRRLLGRLSVFARVIQFDKRGMGLSDRVDAYLPSGLETRVDDVRAVMDAAGSARAVLLGASDGAPISALFAATYPERTRALVLFGGYAHFHASVTPREAFNSLMTKLESTWGSGGTLSLLAPGRAKDARFDSWWARLERLSASPTEAIALFRTCAHIDIRDVLGSIRVPTLVLHRREDACVKFSGGRNLAEKIEGARFVELSGRDHVIWSGEVDRVADEIEQFVTGVRPAPSHKRVLATLMVARLLAPEHLARRLGDGRWRDHLAQFRQSAANAIARFGGETFVVGTEEICARFDAPARAIGCALALRDAADAFDLKLAVGVHTGEVEIHDDTLSGYAVHLTERVAAHAASGEVLVSRVVTDLASGSGLHFAERSIGPVDEGGLRLFSVMVEQHLEPIARSRKTPTLDVLSNREREVLALIADGMSNAAIADRLDLSEHTVKRHVANILVKLDLPTRTAAAAIVARHGVG